MTVSKQAIHCTMGLVGAEKSALVYLKGVVIMNKDWLLGMSLAINVGMGMLLLAWLIGGNA